AACSDVACIGTNLRKAVVGHGAELPARGRFGIELDWLRPRRWRSGARGQRELSPTITLAQGAEPKALLFDEALGKIEELVCVGFRFEFKLQFAHGQFAA